MFGKSITLFTRRSGLFRNADAFLGRLSLTESRAKLKRNRRDFEDSTTALSNSKDSQKAEVELLKDCEKRLNDVVDKNGIDDSFPRY